MKKQSKEKRVLTWGLVGIVAVAITIISDFILLGRPATAYSFFKIGTKTMEEIAPWRLTMGSFLGVIALPFQIFGLIPIYHSMKSSRRILPLLMVLTSAHALIMGVAFHIAYAFIGSAWRLDKKIGNEITADLLDRFAYYWKILLVIMALELVFSSIVYVFIIMKEKTLYPKWMAFINPVCILLILFPLIVILPTPVGGYIAPGYLNITTIIFLGFTSAMYYKKSRNG